MNTPYNFPAPEETTFLTPRVELVQLQIQENLRKDRSIAQWRRRKLAAIQGTDIAVGDCVIDRSREYTESVLCEIVVNAQEYQGEKYVCLKTIRSNPTALNDTVVRMPASPALFFASSAFRWATTGHLKRVDTAPCTGKGLARVMNNEVDRILLANSLANFIEDDWG